jgi:hypothetical protein
MQKLTLFGYGLLFSIVSRVELQYLLMGLLVVPGNIRGAENVGTSGLLCLRSFVLGLYILFKDHFDMTSSF